MRITVHLLIILLALAELPTIASATPPAPQDPARLAEGIWALALRPPEQKVEAALLEAVEEGRPPPGLLHRVAGERTYYGVVVLGDGRLEAGVLSRLAVVRLLLGLGGVKMALLEVSDASGLLKLASLEGVAYVAGDWRAEQPIIRLQAGDRSLPPEPTQLDATRIMGAPRAWEGGFNGSGVRIAVVDTGVDFAISDLKQARHEGIPLSIDTTGLELAIANLDVRPVGLTLPLRGRAAIYFDGLDYKSYIFDFDLGISEEQRALSKSGVFKVGVYAFTDGALGGPWFIPVVLVDSRRPGVYDTAYFDLSTLYARVLEATVLGLGWPAPFPLDLARLKDYSIADEAPHRWGDGSEPVARDINGDGLPDISLGSLAWVDDQLRPGGRGRVPGLGAVDEETPRRLGRAEVWHLVGLQGNRFSDHGTLVATAASGSGLTPYFFPTFPGNRTVVPGVARGATVMAVATRLFTSEIIRGWLWAAGLDPKADGSGFDYTPWRRADVVSNSWGFSSFTVFGLFPPGLSPLAVLANLLSIPGYLHPDFPGVVMVFSAGNSGFGYGSVVDPSAGLLTISVGASTSNFWIHRITNGTQPRYQGFDDLVGFSSRGPTAWGYVKPDLLAIGYAAIGLDGVNWGLLWDFRLHGLYITTIWAGTSLSAPLASGAVAITVQALRSLGLPYDPQLVKDILMASADDLGYEPYAQGAGRVNVSRAVELVHSLAGRQPSGALLARSPVSYEAVRQLQDLQHRRAGQRGFIGGGLPPVRLEMASLYLGLVRPGASRAFEVSVLHAPGLAVEARALRMVKTWEARFDLKLDRDPLFIDLTRLVERGRLLSTDLLRIYVVTGQEGHTMRGEVAPYAYLVDWLDENRNGRYDLETEQHRYSFDSRDAVVLQLNVARPLERFRGNPGIVVRNPTENFELRGPKDLAIVIQQFQREPWPDIRLTQAIPNPRGTTLTLTLQVPPGAQPGLVDGFLEVRVSGARSLLPLSYMVPLELAPDRTTPVRGARGTGPYENYAFLGGEDWAGRPNMADYRFYPILLQAGGGGQLALSVSWSSRWSQLNLLLVGGEQTILFTSPIRFEGRGRYGYSTTTGGTRQVLATGLGPGDGLVILVLQQVISAGFEAFPETVEVQLHHTRAGLLTLSHQATRQAPLPGGLLVAGNLTVQLDVNPALSGLITPRRVALHGGLLRPLEGRILPTEPRWTSTFLPGYPDAPTHFHSLQLREGETVHATLDWDTEGDLDLVVLGPTGEPVAGWTASATLRKPERFSFTVPVTGGYSFLVISFADAPTSYTLRILVQGARPLSHINTPSRSILDTTRLPENQPITLIPVVELSAALNPPLHEVLPLLNITVDNTPPRLTVEGLRDGAFIYGDVEVQLGVEDPHFAGLQMEVDGVASEVRPGRLLLSLPDGDHRVAFRARDLLGNEASQSFLVRVDRSEPWVRLRGLSEGQFLKETVSFTVEARPLYLTRLTMALDGQAEAPVEPRVTLDTRRLPDGPHTITIKAYYESGKQAGLTLQVHVDNTPPSLRVEGISDGQVVRGQVTLTITATDLYLHQVQVEVNGRLLNFTQPGIQWTLDTTRLPDGDHRLLFRAIDRANHTTQLTRSITIDNTAPQLSIESPGDNSLILFTTRIVFTIREPHLKTATLQVAGQTYTLQGSGSIEWNTLQLPDGAHQIRLEAVDEAGNTSSITITVTTINYTLIATLAAAATATTATLLLRHRRKTRTIHKPKG